MKTLLIALLLSCVGLLGCHSNTIDDHKLQKAIRALPDPQTGAMAEKELLNGGKKALEELLWISQGIGEKAAIVQAMVAINCRALPRFSFSNAGYETLLGTFAAKLAVNIMLEKPSLAASMTRSSNPFRRAMAVVSQCNNAREIAQFAKTLKNDPSPLVRSVLLAAIDSVREQMDESEYKHLKYENQIAQTLSQKDCDESNISRIAKKILDGSFGQGTIENSNGSLLIGVKRNDGRFIMLCPACALAVYEKTASKGVFPSWLLEPILYFGIVGPQQLHKAMELLKRDLDKYPRETKNMTIARLINAGGNPPNVAIMPKDRWEAMNPVIIEALARQKKPMAQRLIKKYLLCEGIFSNEKLIKSVGLVDSKPLLDELFDIAENCTDGIVPAFCGLLRASDPRAGSLLHRIMKRDFLDDEVLLDLQEFATAEICSELERLAENGLEHAKTALEKIRPYKCSPQMSGTKQ